MHAGLVASPVMTCNSRNPAKPLETLAQSVNVQRFAISRHKEIRALDLLSSGRMEISSHDLVQVGTDRDAPHSIESATLNCDQRVLQVDAFAKQFQRLACLGSRPVQEQEQCAQSSRVYHARGPFLTVACCPEKEPEFCSRIDVGNKCLRAGWTNLRHRQRLQSTPRCPELEKVLEQVVFLSPCSG